MVEWSMILYTKVHSHDLCFLDTHPKYLSVLLTLQQSLLLFSPFLPVAGSPRGDAQGGVLLYNVTPVWSVVIAVTWFQPRQYGWADGMSFPWLGSVIAGSIWAGGTERFSCWLWRCELNVVRGRHCNLLLAAGLEGTGCPTPWWDVGPSWWLSSPPCGVSSSSNQTACFAWSLWGVF